MKAKNIFRITSLSLLLLFFGIYVAQALGYYNYSSRKTNILTEEAAEKFEADLKNGKKIKASSYLKKENDYNNKLSRGGMKLSNIIESSFNGIMNFLFKEINDAMNE